MDSEQFKQEAEKIEQSLSALRVAERNAVIPFMNGDFTQWDLYLASSSEYAMRLIDGFISMLESRSLVCVAQLPLRILNPRQDFVLGIDANCLPFLMSKFWDAFHNVEWDSWTVGSRGGPL